MTINQAMNSDNMTVQFAPELEMMLERLMREKNSHEQVNPSTTIKGKTSVSDPAVYIGQVQTDCITGKQYKNIITESGKEIRVPVNPVNDPDEPLYTQEEINMMGNYLLNRKGQSLRKLRDYAYFVFSINTWRRAGDNLHLTIGDVLNPDGTFKEWLKIEHEEKTNKKTFTPINSAVAEALKMYLSKRKDYKLSDLLFPADSSGKKMTVDGMCLVFKRAAKALNMPQKIGTHSLRKTGAYHYVMRAENKEDAEREVSQIFGHSSIQVTRRYLMIERQTLKRNFEDRKLEVQLI